MKRLFILLLLICITIIPGAKTPIFNINREVSAESEARAVGLQDRPMLDVRKSILPVFIGENNLTVQPITAKEVLIIDKKTSEPLFSKNPSELLPIASLTKLMTALVLLDQNLDFEEIVEIKPEDRRGGMPEYILSGERVSVKDLWNTMLVASYNTAVAALVRYAGLSEEQFVNLMREKANDLFLFEVDFQDSTGLNPANRASARNIAKLARVAISRSEIAESTREKYYEFITKNTGRRVRLNSTDWLLNSSLNQAPYKIVGGKTGYLDESGYNLVLSVAKDNNEIVVAVLGSESQETRFQEAKALTKWVFYNYRWPSDIKIQER